MKIHYKDKAGKWQVRDVVVDDSSTRIRAIKGDNRVTLNFSETEFFEFPIGSYCYFGDEEGASVNDKYTLEEPATFKMVHSRHFEYTLTMDSVQSRLRKFRMRTIADGELKFDFTGRPQDHLKLLVDNLNLRDKGWTVGEYADKVEKHVAFNYTTCAEALNMMADAFETEWEIVGKCIHLRKVEYNKENDKPLVLEYGVGLKSGVGRQNSDQAKRFELLYIQGGEKNIDTAKYGNKSLLLPTNVTIKYDGSKFEDEKGFDPSKSTLYKTDEKGLFITRADKEQVTFEEASLDLTSINPSRVGEVSEVVTVNAEKNLYDFTDTTIGTLDYKKYIIEGETMTVIFQSGMLAGREFQVSYHHEPTGKGDTAKMGNRFEIVPQQSDGWLPGGVFIPRPGDKYIVFHIALPDEYICDTPNKKGASWDMFRAGVKHFYNDQEGEFSYTGELNGMWAKQEWAKINGFLVMGGYVKIVDPRFCPDGSLIRIVSVKEDLNNRYAPIITLSNSTVGSSVSSELDKLAGQEVVVDDKHREAIQYSKRSYTGALETMRMLEIALSDKFSESISPIAITTMQVLVGDESLQYKYVDAADKALAVSYDNTTKRLSAPAGVIKHFTLGITTISASHDDSEYQSWNMAELPATALERADTSYFVYARVPRKDSQVDAVGTFITSETAINMDGVAGFHHLLVGILNKEHEGSRGDFVSLYGFTEIGPGRITTDRIVSVDGKNFIDLVNNAFRIGNDDTELSFNTEGDGKLRLKGVLIQSPSGEDSVVGVFRGDYYWSTFYYIGDEVTYQGSTYRCIKNCTYTGISPNNSIYWTVMASKGSDGTAGANGTDGVNGVDGLPGSPGNDGVDGLPGTPGSDGTNGLNGAAGVDGVNGVSIVFKGYFTAHPSNPENGWSYYNTTDGKSYVYQDGSWYQMSIDGVNGSDGANGSDGLSIVWKGDLKSPPANPAVNWAYRDTDNGIIYIYNGTAWEVMVLDGSDGTDGTNGVDGLSVFITYNDSTAEPPKPKGDGTTEGWHTAPSSDCMWMSQKVAASASVGTWGTPIKIKGDDGSVGARGATLRGPSEWVARMACQSGGVGEDYIDMVMYNDQIYVCKASHTSSSYLTPTNSTYWMQSNQFEAIATKILWASIAKIGKFNFANSVLTSEEKTSAGVPNLELDGATGFARFIKGVIANLEIKEDRIVGMRSDGSENVVFSNLPLEKESELKIKEDVKVLGGENVLNDFNLTVWHSEYSVSNNLQINITKPGLVSTGFRYSVSHDGGTHVPNVFIGAYMKFRKGSHYIGGFSTLNDGQGSVGGEIELPEGLIDVELKISVSMDSVNDRDEVNGTIDIYSEGCTCELIYYEEKSHYGADGMYLYYGLMKHLYLSKTAADHFFKLRGDSILWSPNGKHGLQVTDGGVQATSNSGTSWRNL